MSKKALAILVYFKMITKTKKRDPNIVGLFLGHKNATHI